MSGAEQVYWPPVASAYSIGRQTWYKMFIILVLNFCSVPFQMKTSSKLKNMVSSKCLPLWQKQTTFKDIQVTDICINEFLMRWLAYNSIYATRWAESTVQYKYFKCYKHWALQYVKYVMMDQWQEYALRPKNRY